MSNDKIFSMPFGKVFPLLIAKAERKSRTREEVYKVTAWLTGYTPAQLDALLEDAEQMLPTLTLTVLPEGLEELGELRWEEHEDGTASVYLTDEQVQRLLELLAEQGLEGLLSMPAAADEEKWLVVLREN